LRSEDDGPAAVLAALPPDVRAAFERTEAVVFDVDGVLTDGRIHCRDDRTEGVSFHVRDSSGLWQLHKAGLRAGFVTGRATGIPEDRRRLFPFSAHRCDALDKETALRSILDEWSLAPERCAYVGDDLLDGPALRIAGLPICVADAERHRPDEGVLTVVELHHRRLGVDGAGEGAALELLGEVALPRIDLCALAEHGGVPLERVPVTGRHGLEGHGAREVIAWCVHACSPIGVGGRGAVRRQG